MIHAKLYKKSGFYSLNSLDPSVRHLIPVGLKIIFMGAGNINVLIVAERQLNPPSVRQIAFYEYHIILKISDPYMVFNKTA